MINKKDSTGPTGKNVSPKVKKMEISMPEDMAANLCRIAEDECRTPEQQIVYAVKQWLDDFRLHYDVGMAGAYKLTTTTIGSGR